jgi:hypothetical protein
LKCSNESNSLVATVAAAAAAAAAVARLDGDRVATKRDYKAASLMTDVQCPSLAAVGSCRDKVLLLAVQ